MAHNTPLADFPINIRLKLSALWSAVMFCYIYGDYFQLYIPKKVEQFISGDTLLDSPVKLFLASILMAIPALMVFLSLVLKPFAAKWLNIIFGTIYTGIMVLIAITSIAPWWSFYVFLAIIESIITATIAWYAWRWPGEEEAKGIPHPGHVAPE
jgi:hypothetical protein